MISCKNITKEYPIKNGEKFYALNNINLHIKQGEFVAVLGKSGSGKSTLMNLIGLIDTPSSGKVYINNIDTNNYSEYERAIIRNQKIGYIFQSFFLDPSYTAYKNVEIPMLIKGISKKQRKEKVMEILAEVGMENKYKNMVNTLSGGEQQRISIARALVNNPDILLADEPCGNLDSANSEIVMKILRQQNNDGKTIVLITHSIEEAKNAQRNIIIKDGIITDETTL